MCTYTTTIRIAMTNLVRIGSGFRKLWRHTFNMGKSIYGFSRLTARWVLRVFSLNLVYVCTMLLWVDLQNIVRIGSGSRILWRIKNPSVQHEKSLLRISTCYISFFDEVIRLKMVRIIHIDIVCRPVKCDPDLIRIVVLRILWRTENPSAQHWKSHLRISTSYLCLGQSDSCGNG